MSAHSRTLTPPSAIPSGTGHPALWIALVVLTVIAITALVMSRMGSSTVVALDVNKLPPKPTIGTIKIPETTVQIQIKNCSQDSNIESQIRLYGTRRSVDRFFPELCTSWQQVANWLDNLVKELRTAELDGYISGTAKLATIKYLVENVIPALRAMPIVP